jgi:hypothetical protein
MGLSSSVQLVNSSSSIVACYSRPSVGHGNQEQNAAGRTLLELMQERLGWGAQYCWVCLPGAGRAAVWGRW